MLPYRSIKPLLYVAMFSLYATALALELYIYALLRDYGQDQTDAVGIITVVTAILTVAAIILAVGLWLHKRSPHWVKRLKQNEALRRAEHNLASQNAKAYIRQYIKYGERRSNGSSEDS